MKHLHKIPQDSEDFVEDLFAFHTLRQFTLDEQALFSGQIPSLDLEERVRHNLFSELDIIFRAALYHNVQTPQYLLIRIK